MDGLAFGNFAGILDERCFFEVSAVLGIVTAVLFDKIIRKIGNNVEMSIKHQTLSALALRFQTITSRRSVCVSGLCFPPCRVFHSFIRPTVRVLTCSCKYGRQSRSRIPIADSFARVFRWFHVLWVS